MDQAALYDEDIYAWSQHQARVLRGLARADARLPNDLDLEHVAEEIEDLGNEQRFQVESTLRQALIHIIKLAVLLADQAVLHWTTEANAFLDTAFDRYRPSMRQVIDPAKLWSRACRRAAQDLAGIGHAVPPLPAGLPFAFEDLVNEAADAQALAAELAAMLGPSPEA
jgi:hypothetical protein